MEKEILLKMKSLVFAVTLLSLVMFTGPLSVEGVNSYQVCHNGETLNVASEGAYNGHLGHGDPDGPCADEPDPVLGCMDPEANNYDPEATEDDDSCTYDVPGCMDPEATNYDPEATVDDESCTYPELVENTEPLCTDEIDNDEDELVDEADPDCAEFYVDNDADDDTILDDVDNCPADANTDQADNDEDGIGNVCDETPNGEGGEDVLGCTDPDATNYDPEATLDDESCTYPELVENTEPLCTDEIDNDEDELVDEADPDCAEFYPDDTDDDITPPSNGGGGISSSGSRRSSQGEVLGASTSCGIYMNDFIRSGRSNNVEQVTKLQTFLRDYLNISLIPSGVFGPETQSALSQFQAMHSDEILAPWGITTPTGIAYVTTVRKINNLMCPELNLPIPTSLAPWSVR